MLKIDSHQHFWIYHPVKDAWITDDLKVIQENFLPADVLPVLKQNSIAGCVAVQAGQSEQENEFLIKLAVQHSFIKGIVGWVDLRSDSIGEQLQHYSETRIIKGFRHILQGEPDDKYMLDKKFMHGISLLDKYGFTYDILIKPHHLPYARELVAAFPRQRFVIDHLAKPFIKDKLIDAWKRDIQTIAAFPNVYCKVSGMVTEAGWGSWLPGDFVPYMDVVFGAFGAGRVMFGSDWPVCNLAGGYDGVLQVADHYVTRLSRNEQELFWAGNAIDFYQLTV